MKRARTTEALTARELKLLQLFHAHPREVLSRDRLLNEVWGINYYGTTRTLDQVIVQLRRKLGEPADRWAIAGLLHDADYEAHTDQHPTVIVGKLKAAGEEEIAHAVSAHYTKWGVPYESRLDKALLACDELSGFIVACAQVRPEGLATLEAKSVIKKLKDKGFATLFRNSFELRISMKA